VVHGSEAHRVGRGLRGAGGLIESDVLDLIDVLHGQKRQVIELPGGLTNRNLRVTTAEGDYVVRCAQSDAGLLGIDREAEHRNSVAAAQAGVGAEVVDYRPDLGILVIGYLEGRTLQDADFADPAVLDRAADACRRLHAGPRFVNDFDMFLRQAGYLRTIRERGFPLPPGYDDHADRWDDVRRALAATAGPTVPCNNDLLAGNFIDDGDRIWLIDYEYSGNNDPCFELGNTATECEFTADQTETYTAAYFGRSSRRLVARVRLQALCSEYGWSLWGFIQAAASPMEFDFHGWGMHRFDKAARTFSSPLFARLLDEVQLDE
jgi:thiamine kinase-like enzyme